MTPPASNSTTLAKWRTIFYGMRAALCGIQLQLVARGHVQKPSMKLDLTAQSMYSLVYCMLYIVGNNH